MVTSDVYWDMKNNVPVEISTTLHAISTVVVFSDFSYQVPADSYFVPPPECPARKEKPNRNLALTLKTMREAFSIFREVEM